MAQGNINMNQNVARAGLDTDNIVGQIEQGYVTDALNAINGSLSGTMVTYQNEEGNSLCVTLPTGYKCIGVKNVTELGQVWYWLTNPITGYSIIGYVPIESCTFSTVVDDSVAGSDLLNFSVQYPIHKVEVKTTNCSTQLYWTDRYNHRRYIDLNNLPWKTGTTNVVDTNKMEIQPLFDVPKIIPTQIAVGGTLVEGVYQFAVQYASTQGEGLTSWYSVTNPVRVFLNNKVSADFNLQTTQSISLNITDLDTSGLYNYFNLAAIKTINGATTVELVGTFHILHTTYTHLYTGGEQSNSNILLTLTDILTQNDYYDIAGTLTQVDNQLVWADLVKEEDISYQQIFNQVRVNWGTSEMPVQKGYHDGVVCAEVEGYFRDEVYALEGCFILANGKETTRCHIPGRVANSFDLQFINNNDSEAIVLGTCPTPTVPRWKVYNTGSVIGRLPGTTDPCTGVTPYEYGTMSYWESEEVYPDNVAVWGSLAGQKIRHHKFPDTTISPLFKQVGTDYYVYPIGFKIDIGSLYNAIQTSFLTDAQKRSIVGFKVMRSDRGANRSIVAKGLFYNMGIYGKQEQNYLYPNYPFNDVRPDPFISNVPVNNKTGAHQENWLNNFQRSRLTFHSPDTHFYQPTGIQGSVINLETAYQGQCKSHFVKVLDNAGEKLLTKTALETSLAVAVVSVFGVDISNAASAGTVTGTTLTVTPTINFQNFLPTYNNMLQIIDKIIPYYNYGWQYNGVGYYNQTINIPTDTGNKVRYIKYGGYINPGLQASFGDLYPINNTGRESSVFISLSEDLPYTHEQVNTSGVNLGILHDTSRTTANSITGVGKCFDTTFFYRDISSYYGSIKTLLPAQYGQIFSYRAIDTGILGKFLDSSGNVVTDLPIVYGGDCFINRFALKIKHPFFLKNTVGLPNGYDIDYNQSVDSNGQPYTNTGNVGYPIWYYSTENLPYTLDPQVHAGVVNFSNDLTLNVFGDPHNPFAFVLSTITFVPFAIIDIFQILIGLFASSGVFFNLGLKVTNLECYNDTDLYEQGMSYLYAYGIPYYFCESEVNVDMRQAFNDKEGDFYPRMSTDVPDNWLQEKNVPIVFDNTYTYNKTYSKQNHETAFTTLRPDWSPNQLCYINYNNRAVWSEASDLEDVRNNWLVYKPANTFDFPKSFGSLVAIDRLETRSVLVRYVNHSQLYNVQATIETTAINASLGTGDLFSGTQPIDFNMVDTGFAGSQHKMILHCDEGHLFVDAMRGQVILLRGTSIEELSSYKYKNSRWFKNNLPFYIIKSFPNYPVDNAFNNIGLHGVYDATYKRFILTKIDYQPINGVQWNGTNFYVQGTLDPTGNKDVIVQLGDPAYFCNKSWTMSFSFVSMSWISWHSYIPNYYIGAPDFFQSGTNSTGTTWDHNTVVTVFNKFYGVDYPYIIEYPMQYQYEDQLLQHVEEYVTVLKYESDEVFYEPDEQIYFTQAVIYNKQASTGLLNLVPKNMTNMAQYLQYPVVNTDSLSILVSKVDHLYSYNMIWNNQVNANVPQWRTNCTPSQGSKTLNNTNFVYSNNSFKKYPLRAKDTVVREILNRENNEYKLITRFVITKTQNMHG